MSSPADCPPPYPTGVCQFWVDPDTIPDCCTDLGTNADLGMAAWVASDLLYEMSGRRYGGVCETTVRPCAETRSCFVPPLTYTRGCSCRPLSSVRLAGYPVREIVEVMIDGDVIDPSEYRLDRDRELVAQYDRRWPRCQNLHLPPGDPGTWTVTYRHGLAPPPAGVLAAQELACQIAKASCSNGDGGLVDDCELPAGTVRVTRQGITIDTNSLGLWLVGSIRTGLPLVDAFVSVYAQQGKRRVALMVPEQDPWPLRVTETPGT
jgi:hypothetical protein